MTIQIELDTEVEAQLAAEANAHGVAPEDYVVVLLKRALNAEPRDHTRATPEEVRAILNALASGVPDAPHLRSEIFSRDFIYGDHD